MRPRRSNVKQVGEYRKMENFGKTPKGRAKKTRKNIIEINDKEGEQDDNNENMEPTQSQQERKTQAEKVSNWCGWLIHFSSFSEPSLLSAHILIATPTNSDPNPKPKV